MTATRAHADSLPLFSIIDGLHEGKPPWDASATVSDMLHKLKLEKDIEAVIFIDHESCFVNLRAISPYGIEVLEELRVRTEFIPCPSDTCEPHDSPTGFCKWCGRPYTVTP